MFHNKISGQYKVRDQKNPVRVILQHNRRFDIVLHTAGLSITKTDNSENSLFAAAEYG